MKKNFFKHVFEKTFHYTDEGWNKFTLSFSLFFFLTAILNEVIIQLFDDHTQYPFLGHNFDGVGIWILFKVAVIMPLSGIYAWYLTRVMQKYRIDDPTVVADDAASARTSNGYVDPVVRGTLKADHGDIAAPSPPRSPTLSLFPESGGRK